MIHFAVLTEPDVLDFVLDGPLRLWEASSTYGIAKKVCGSEPLDESLFELISFKTRVPLLEEHCPHVVRRRSTRIICGEDRPVDVMLASEPIAADRDAGCQEDPSGIGMFILSGLAYLLPSASPPALRPIKGLEWGPPGSPFLFPIRPSGFRFRFGRILPICVPTGGNAFRSAFNKIGVARKADVLSPLRGETLRRGPWCPRALISVPRWYFQSVIHELKVCLCPGAGCREGGRAL